MGQYVDFYCRNYNQRLKKIVNHIIEKNFGWIANSEYDDFYSIAMKVVWDCERNFDKTKNTKFETYLTSCLLRKVKTHVTYMNRDKRKNKGKDRKIIDDVSMDAAINEEDRCMQDLIGKIETIDAVETCRTQEYMATLSDDAKQVLDLILKGYSWDVIRERTGYTAKYLNDLVLSMRRPERIKILRRDIE